MRDVDVSDGSTTDRTGGGAEGAKLFAKTG